MGIQGYANNQNNNLPNQNENFIKCEKCGEQNEVGSLFCWRCGDKINTNTADENDVIQENNVEHSDSTGAFQEGEYNRQYTYTQDNIVGESYASQAQSDTMFGENKYRRMNGLSARISTKDWMKVFCLNFLSLIPFIGSLLLVIIVIVLAFKQDVAESIKSYFKAQLIFSLITLGICIVFFILFFSVIFTSIVSGNSSLEGINQFV